MAAASCNILLKLPFSKNPNLRPISPSSTLALTTTTSSASSHIRPFASSPGAIRPSALLSTAAGDFQWPAIDPAESAANPALRNANVLFFRSGYNVQIVVGEEEPEEVLLRRFRREVSKAGVIQEYKRRRFFENKQEEKKRKAREAGRRNRRRRSGPRFTSSSLSSTDNNIATKKAGEDADDNWDMPEGGLPY